MSDTLKNFRSPTNQPFRFSRNPIVNPAVSSMNQREYFALHIYCASLSNPSAIASIEQSVQKADLLLEELAKVKK